MKEQFPARMLRVHCGEDDKWQGKPLYEAVLTRCHNLGIAGAMVLRGIEGYGASTRIHRAGSWKLSKDAPITISAIGTEKQIAGLLPHLDEMVVEGLVAISPVEVIRLSAGPREIES